MKVKHLTTVAILVALSIIASFIAFPIIPGASFLKLDISDIFTLMALYFVGWKGLFIAGFSKGLFLYLKSSDPIGALSNIIVAIVFNATYYTIQRKTKRCFLAGVGATLVLTFVMAILNYFVFLPLYAALFHIELGDLAHVVLFAIVPFNLMKGAVLAVLDTVFVKRYHL